MHICLLELAIPPHTIGGAEIQAWELARRLAKKHRVTLVVRRFENEPIEEDRQGVLIRRVAVPGAPLALAVHLVRYLQLLHTIKRTIDVVIAFRAIPNGIVSALAKRFWQIPCCVSIRGLDWYHHTHNQLGRSTLRLVANHNTAVHAQTSRIAADVRTLTHHITPVIIPNGIEASEECAHGQSVLYVGGLTPHKGVDTLVDAMRQLPDKHLLIVGDGPERRRLEALAQGMNVTFAGQVAPDEVHNIMVAEGRVLVLPTVTSEGMPNVIIQAMAVRLPVITTSIPGGVQDVVSHEKTGLLVPARDPTALAHAIQRLTQDNALRNQLTVAGLAQADTFGWRHVLTEWEVLLESLVQ